MTDKDLEEIEMDLLIYHCSCGLSEGERFFQNHALALLDEVRHLKQLVTAACAALEDTH